MVLESYLLLKQRPAADVDMRDVALGEVSDGIWLADSFPTSVEFGVLLELSMGAEESGTDEVALLLSESRPMPGQFIVLAEKTVVATPASSGHWTPRFGYYAFGVELSDIRQPVELVLWAAINYRLIALKPLVVRAEPDLPPAEDWAARAS